MDKMYKCLKIVTIIAAIFAIIGIIYAFVYSMQSFSEYRFMGMLNSKAILSIIWVALDSISLKVFVTFILLGITYLLKEQCCISTNGVAENKEIVEKEFKEEKEIENEQIKNIEVNMRMKKEELIGIANSLGLEVKPSNKKAEIIELINGHNIRN